MHSRCKVRNKERDLVVKNGHCLLVVASFVSHYSLMVGTVASEKILLLYVADVLHVF